MKDPEKQLAAELMITRARCDALESLVLVLVDSLMASGTMHPDSVAAVANEMMPHSDRMPAEFPETGWLIRKSLAEQLYIAHDWHFDERRMRSVPPREPEFWREALKTAAEDVEEKRDWEYF